jgi:glycosyltransferase involved in cell wall biosynthesis
MRKYKVLWLSDLVTPTGFSQVAHSILKYMPKELFEIVGLGINYFGNPHKYGFDIYPAINGVGSRDVFGYEKLPFVLNEEQPELIYILNDPWIIGKYLEIIKKFYSEMGKSIPKIIVYFPVDSEDHEPSWYKHFDIVSQAVVYTKFGQEVVKKAVPILDTRIIYHGVDTDVFKKIFPTRLDAKKDVFRNTESLVNTFIILNANRNQPRKRLDITLRAFKLFAKDKDDVRLYMHCGAQDAHLDVGRFALKLGIDNKLILTNLNRGVQSLPKESLNAIYNACDVGINTGLGEGWGLTAIEHGATGAPQIVPNHSALGEIYKDCGVLVKKAMPFTLETSTTGYLVHEKEVAKAMNLLYNNREYYNELSEKTYKKFTSPAYSWQEISKVWYNLFMEVLTR